MTLREAAQQALEALEGWKDEAPSQWTTGDEQTITALKAALAQEEKAEPVAWMYEGIRYDGTKHGQYLVWKPAHMDAMSADKGAKATPLYTSPPQRKPLTEAQIYAAIKSIDSLKAVEVARAIERAHGIGDSNE